MLRRKRLFRTVTAIALALSLIMSCTFVSSAASGTVKSKLYSEVIKSGKYVYCTDGHSIYRVNIKNNKVKRLVKEPIALDITMKLHKGYIYYMWSGEADYSDLCRVKAKGGGKKTLATDVEGIRNFAIKGKRIYYAHYNGDDPDNPKKVYDRNKTLNGKNKKKNKVKGYATVKKRNAKGYTIVKKFSSDFYENPNGYMITYLRKPNGKLVKLGKTKAIELWA